nr:hypothetical protein [Tanacetum cinerariifolium]
TAKAAVPESLQAPDVEECRIQSRPAIGERSAL